MLNSIQETVVEGGLDNCSKDALVSNYSMSSLTLPRRKPSLKRPSSVDLPENIKNHTLVYSYDDDELPDDLIVFDIPSLETLQSLETHRNSSIRRTKSMKMASKSRIPGMAPQFFSPPSSSRMNIGGALSTMSSPATRASSIFSQSSTYSDCDYLDDDYHNQLSKEAKMLFSNKNYKLEEAMQRISMLKSLSRQSLASVSSFASQISSDKLLESKTNDFITATRQPNLPPKQEIDVQKHELEYQRILRSQIYLENEKLMKYNRTIAINDKQNKHDYSLWMKVISNYDILINLPQTRELWWRFMSSNARPIVWNHQLISKRIEFKENFEQLFVEGNSNLELACSYKMATDELMKIKIKKDSPNIIDLVENIEKYSVIIQLTFPDINIFQYGAMFDSILKITLVFDQLKGQSENLKKIKTERLIGIISILHQVLRSEVLTIKCLLSLIQKKLLLTLLENEDSIPDSLTEQIKGEKEGNVSDYLVDVKNQFDKFLLHLEPRLYNHFVQNDINTLKLIQKVVSNLFTKQFSYDICLRIIDIYLFEGDVFLLRCLLALVQKLNWKLFGSKEETYQILGDECLIKLNNLSDVASLNSGSTLRKSNCFQFPKKFVYLDVGETQEFINNVRSVLKKNHN